MPDYRVHHEDNLFLHLAVIEENRDVVKFLIKHGMQVNARACNRELSLQFPTDIEHQKQIDTTLAEIIDEDIVEDKIEASQTKTTTALHLASRSENKDIAELLLIEGADANAEMEGGETPLIVAVLSKNYHVVELLLAHGAEVNIPTAWGKTALHYAVQTNQKQMLELLIQFGGNVNAANLEGLTPLHMAAETGHLEIVALLLDNGAEVEIKTKAGATVLHYAAVMGHQDVVEMLLDRGTDINIILKYGGVDLSPFKWVTAAEEKKTWDLVSKYTNKTRLMNWYNSVVMKLSKVSMENKSPENYQTEQQ